MSSRDGVHFDRSFMQAWIRPGFDPTEQGCVHGNTDPAWGLVRTGPNELSVYWCEMGKRPGATPRFRPGTLRVDGFVSMHAEYETGEFTTKLRRFVGNAMTINFSTSAIGRVQVEIQDAAGQAVKGFALADCNPIFGDKLDQVVRWSSNGQLERLAGKPVRLRFVLKDADLYAIQFQASTNGTSK